MTPAAVWALTLTVAAVVALIAGHRVRHHDDPRPRTVALGEMFDGFEEEH